MLYFSRFGHRINVVNAADMHKNEARAFLTGKPASADD